MKSVIKIIAIVAGLLIGVFGIWYYFVNNTTFPEEVLMVGEQVDDNGRVHFYKNIKEEEKIARYKKLYNSIGIIYEGEEPKDYPDFVISILNPESMVTHNLNIWVKEDQVIVFKRSNNSSYFRILSSAQFKELKEILEIE
ncbi:hypothetical protein [Alkaliphilus transvaalensis]|uniref:hypothetical protein n=1 Tax=Alkaliphilus transvaalensis TaxID=114628 RepID=UPI00047C2E7E|nr:hypothetical protein [Alkaliphilus transvaalensis]